MHFAREDFNSDYLIRAYEPGRITIGDQPYTHSLILAGDQLIADWRPQQVNTLCEDDFAPVLALQPEIVLLGTGLRLQFPEPALSVWLMQSGVGLEVMDTAAACRTFNILLSEQRRVAAALLLE